jgi:ribonuclease HII
MLGPPPTFRAERKLWKQGVEFIAGIDEVGRGPLAGPVAAGAVILPEGARFRWLRRVRDSKELSPEARDELAACIWRDALAAGVGFVSVETIDRIGIAEASRQAMLAAIGELKLRPQHLMIDAFRIPACRLEQTNIIGGDGISLSIACAAIVAKVARDHYMHWQEPLHPGYGFITNKGYATPEHMRAIRDLGPCDLHRRSFAPVRDMVAPAPLVAAV